MRVTITPRYKGDRWPSAANQPCDEELAVRLCVAGERFAASADPQDLANVTFMSIPRWQRGFGWRKHLTTNLTPGQIWTMKSHIRTFGVDQQGQLYSGRTYKEISSELFVSLHPLRNCTMDAQVLQMELLPLLLGKQPAR